jgi:hypothetical protein
MRSLVPFCRRLSVRQHTNDPWRASSFPVPRSSAPPIAISSERPNDAANLFGADYTFNPLDALLVVFVVDKRSTVSICCLPVLCAVTFGVVQPFTPLNSAVIVLAFAVDNRHRHIAVLSQPLVMLSAKTFCCALNAN